MKLYKSISEKQSTGKYSGISKYIEHIRIYHVAHLEKMGDINKLVAWILTNI